MARKPQTRIDIPAPSTVLYKEVKAATHLVLTGRLIAVDPSCGSTSSMPAIAVYERGIFVRSELLFLDTDKSLEERLSDLGHLCSELKCDVLAYEDIPPVRFHKSGRTSAASQSSLIKALGAILGTITATQYVGLRPSVWKRMTGPNYVKSDEGDATEMGEIVVRVARYIGGK